MPVELTPPLKESQLPRPRGSLHVVGLSLDEMKGSVKFAGKGLDLNVCPAPSSCMTVGSSGVQRFPGRWEFALCFDTCLQQTLVPLPALESQREVAIPPQASGSACGRGDREEVFPETTTGPGYRVEQNFSSSCSAATEKTGDSRTRAV